MNQRVSIDFACKPDAQKAFGPISLLIIFNKRCCTKKNLWNQQLSNLNIIKYYVSNNNIIENVMENNIFYIPSI